MNSVHILIDNVDYTVYATKTSQELLLEATDDIPDLDEPHEVTLSVADVNGNVQQMSVDPHLIDPGELDPDNPRPTGTTAHYKLHRNGDVLIRIYNVDDGYLYREIDVGSQTSGFQSYEWDGLDDYGYPVPQGLYCMEIWYYDGGEEYIGSVWPDPSTYLPLGEANARSGSVAATGSGSSKIYRIWNPTDGKLQIKISGTSGLVAYLRKTEKKTGQVIDSAVLTGSGNKHLLETTTAHKGYYYYVTVNGNGHSGSFEIYAQFFQQAAATSPKPWCGWWWPTWVGRSGPHMWSDTGAACPLLKYDQAYGTTARNYEYTYASSNNGWDSNTSGHCWGWTLSSLFHSEPTTSQTKNGVTFTVDEQKGLLAQLYDPNDPDTHDDYPGFCTNRDHIKPEDASAYAKPFYDVLYNGMKVNGKGLRADLEKSSSVTTMNFPAWRYASEFKHFAGEGADKRFHVKVTTTIDHATEHPFPPPSSGKVSIEVTYGLWFYKNQTGRFSPVIPNSIGQPHSWLESSLGIIPCAMEWYTGLIPAPDPGHDGWHNPQVTQANVNAIVP